MSDLDFPAKQAREFTDNHEQMKAEQWYDEFKYKLFDNIKDVALEGSYSLTISSVFWGRNNTKKEYLASNLESLGYKISINEDGSMSIYW